MKLKDCFVGMIVETPSGEVGHIYGLKYIVRIKFDEEPPTGKQRGDNTALDVLLPDGQHYTMFPNEIFRAGTNPENPKLMETE